MESRARKLNPFTLAFYASTLERSFVNYHRTAQLAYLQAGYGFLVLFFMCITAAQTVLISAPLYTHLVYAGLGVASLFGFSLMSPRRRRSLMLMWAFAGSIAVVASLAIYLPASNALLQLTAATVSLLWFSLFAGLLFREVGLLLAAVLLPTLATAAFLLRPLQGEQSALIAAMSLAALSVSLSAYFAERRSRVDFGRQHSSRSIASRLDDKPLLRADQALQVLKELTAELSNARDSNGLYDGIAKYLQRVCRYDLIAIGRHQNDRMVPALVKSSKSKIDSESTLKQLWYGSLIQQLQKSKTPLTGQAEMGLLPSVLLDGEISFGYRLDIPFFSQGKLDGVVTLLRSPPAFNDAESAVASSVVFHALFAYRSARLQQPVEQRQAVAVVPAAAAITKAASVAAAKPVERLKILPVEDFMEQANVVFQQAKLAGQPQSLLLVELDNHGQISGRYGVQVNKRVMELLARTLMDHAMSGCLLGRYGSGSFAMQVPLALPEAKALAEKIRVAIKDRPLRIEQTTVKMTISVGVCSRDQASPDFVSLLRGADVGLYMAREQHGNAVRVRQ